MEKVIGSARARCTAILGSSAKHAVCVNHQSFQLFQINYCKGSAMGAEASSAYGRSHGDEHESQQRRNAMMMRSFLGALDGVLRDIHASALVVTNASSFNVKPSIIPSNYSACTPIHVQGLHINTTHRGRVLQGTIVSPRPVVMTSAMVILEDDMGDYVLVRTSHCR